MLKLEKITRNNNIIKCILYPESSEKGCSFTYNLDTDEVECELPEGYEYCEMHIRNAKYYLYKNQDNLPDHKMIMWY